MWLKVAGGSAPILWLVIPCFDEEEVLPLTSSVFLKQIEINILRGGISPKSRICFVDDGSKDSTWEIIQRLSAMNELFCGITLSRNRGHQNALLAGLMEARKFCDIAISADCDGQDDISAIDKMIDAYAEGYEIVYGVRSSRETDSRFKRISAELFYRVMDGLGVETVFNHADYRLMSKAALDGLSEFTEVNLYLRGMVPMVGYPSTIVEYRRAERVAGDSHYPLSKMLSLAFDGITSLSVGPMRMIAVAGIIASVVGLFGIVWAVVVSLLGVGISGWASMICVVCFFGGLQLLAMGVIGEYIGKIYLETKRRPRYIVSSRTWNV